MMLLRIIEQIEKGQIVKFDVDNKKFDPVDYLIYIKYSNFEKTIITEGIEYAPYDKVIFNCRFISPELALNGLSELIHNQMNSGYWVSEIKGLIIDDEYKDINLINK